MEDYFQWKTTFDGIQSSMEDNIWREKTELLNWRLLKLEFDTKDQVLLPMFYNVPQVGSDGEENERGN